MHASGSDAHDRLARVRTEDSVLRDERAVEVDREGRDALGEVGRKLD
jgi:hypothetical protein